MLQSKQRLLQLNAKLADTLTSKGVAATADETTTALVNKVADIPSGDNSVLKGLIQRNLTEIVIPDGVTVIGSYSFSYCDKLKSVTIPGSVKTVGSLAFISCTSLKNLTILSKIVYVMDSAFRNCNALEYVYLPFNFNSDINLSASTLYTRETILQWLNALADRTGQKANKLLIGATNLAKLTEEDILIATNKNWTLA